MKSSTLHKPGISKERIAALEELLSDKSGSPYDSSPGVYVRSDKDRELDILWQGYKINSKEEKSPGFYLAIGFVTGVLCMFLVTTILNLGKTSNEGYTDLNLWKKGNSQVQVKPVQPVSVTTASPSEAQSTTTEGQQEIYVIQSGDTLEKVSLKYYGTSDPTKIKEIQDANKMSDPNKLQIGQKIVVPIQN
jgi:LysM repeat protein